MAQRGAIDQELDAIKSRLAVLESYVAQDARIADLEQALEALLTAPAPAPAPEPEPKTKKADKAKEPK